MLCLQTSIVNGNVKEPSVEKLEDNSDVASEDNDKNEANENASNNEEKHVVNTELDDSASKEPLVDNEISGDRLKPEEIAEPLIEEKQSSKESSPANDENGGVSSREQSFEKEVVQQIKENPSETLIESEKAVAAEQLPCILLLISSNHLCSTKHYSFIIIYNHCSLYCKIISNHCI